MLRHAAPPISLLEEGSAEGSAAGASLCSVQSEKAKRDAALELGHDPSLLDGSQSGSDFSDLEMEDLTAVRLRARTPPWQKQEESQWCAEARSMRSSSACAPLQLRWLHLWQTCGRVLRMRTRLRRAGQLSKLTRNKAQSKLEMRWDLDASADRLDGARQRRRERNQEQAEEVRLPDGGGGGRACPLPSWWCVASHLRLNSAVLCGGGRRACAGAPDRGVRPGHAVAAS